MRLLDLPDEVLELIEKGRLSEGHGRALLTTKDHGERRRLAREAVDRSWSVRELEDRAREGEKRTTKSRRRTRATVTLHPDHAHALEQIAEALSTALGAEVRVRPHGEGCRIELDTASLEDARELAARLGVRVAA